MIAAAFALFIAAGSADACDRPATMTADAMVVCLDRAQIAADRELNTAYQAALRSLAPTDAAALREAQRAWLAFRDKNRASLLHGAWRATRSTRVRIDAAKADILGIEARTEELDVYLTAGR